MANAGTSSGAELTAEKWLWRTPTGLVAWDFDLTVLKVHAFGEGIEPEEVAERWQEDICDAELMRAFVAKARELGVRVGIASFGRAEVIHEYLKHLVPGAFRPEDIVTPAALNLPDVTDGMQVPNGKVLMLELQCAPLELLPIARKRDGVWTPEPPSAAPDAEGFPF